MHTAAVKFFIINISKKLLVSTHCDDSSSYDCGIEKWATIYIEKTVVRNLLVKIFELKPGLIVVTHNYALLRKCSRKLHYADWYENCMHYHFENLSGGIKYLKQNRNFH